MSPVPTIKKTPVAIKIAIVLGALAVLAAAGYFILVQPKKSEARSLSKEIDDKTQQINARRAQAQQAAGLSKILVADYFKLTTAMPDETQVAEIHLQIDAIARATGVAYEGITPGDVVDASTYQVLPFDLTFEGSFYDLSDFLRRVRSLVLVQNHKLIAKGRLFTVDQVGFAEGDKGFPDIKATLEVNAFVFGHPVTVAGTGGTATTTTPGGETGTSTTSTTTTPTDTSETASATGGG
jgi:Tfp pilus assembly protein PilO